MITHLRLHLRAFPVKYDQIRFLHGHVAGNAVARGQMIGFRKRGCVRLVTAQTTLRESHGIVLAGVNIVAGKASHRR